MMPLALSRKVRVTMIDSIHFSKASMSFRRRIRTLKFLSWNWTQIIWCNRLRKWTKKILTEKWVKKINAYPRTLPRLNLCRINHWNLRTIFSSMNNSFTASINSRQDFTLLGMSMRRSLGRNSRKLINSSQEPTKKRRHKLKTLSNQKMTKNFSRLLVLLTIRLSKYSHKMM